jgi:pimeloyl-ACP methyl ester carboxylesterase
VDSIRPSCNHPTGQSTLRDAPGTEGGQAGGRSRGSGVGHVAGNHHRFCGYDRANTGNSDKVPGPLDGETTVAGMHRLLKAAHIDPPYVLLGASFGGLFAYMYAVTYPKEVVGMVLLDASFPEEQKVPSRSWSR